MSRQIADNLSYRGKKFIDERGSIAKVSDFATLVENYYPNGFVAYCKEDCSYYRFDEFASEINPTTGKWQRVGAIAGHAQVLGDNGRPSIFNRLRYKITSGGTLPTDATAGDYVTIDEAAVPFAVGDLEFTEANQVAHFDGSNWYVCHLPNEGEVHIFQQYIDKYTEPAAIPNGSNPDIPGGKTYPCKVIGKFELAQKLIDAGWEFISDMGNDYGAGIKFTQVVGYRRGSEGPVANLGSKVFYANPVQAGSITIGIDKITIPSVGDIEYADVTVDMIKEWENGGLILSKSLDSCAFEADMSGYICHFKNDKSFDNLANLTEVRAPYRTAPMSLVRKADLDLIYSYDGAIPSETGYLCHIQIYGEDRGSAIGDLTGTTTPTGWVYDPEGFWTKVFPADLELDSGSENSVANGVITRAIGNAGHSVKLIYESDVKVLTSVLLDKYENEISRVAVALDSVAGAAPKCALSIDNTLFKKGTTSDIEVNITVAKGDNKLSTVELYDITSGATVKTWDEDSGLDVDEQSQTLTYTIEGVSASAEYIVHVYDNKALYGDSEKVKIYFVSPCLHNPDGTQIFVESLSRDGFTVFMFDFESGDSPVLTSKPIIRIPVSILGDEPIAEPRILGGVNEHYMFTDYTESFDISRITEDEVEYIEYKLKDNCGLHNFYFETVKAN